MITIVNDEYVDSCTIHCYIVIIRRVKSIVIERES